MNSTPSQRAVWLAEARKHLGTPNGALGEMAGYVERLCEEIDRLEREPVGAGLHRESPIDATCPTAVK